MNNDTSRKIGRRAAGSWGKPRKGLRKEANKASRRAQRRLAEARRNGLFDFDEGTPARDFIPGK